MRIFSNILVNLYHNQVSSTTIEGREFNDLRDATRKDACMYTKGALPLATSAVGKLKGFLQNYHNFTFEEWKENLVDIREDVRVFKQTAWAIVAMHQITMTGLVGKQKKAKDMQDKFEILKNGYKTRIDVAKKKAEKAAEWKLVHFVPILGIYQWIKDVKDMRDAHATEVAELAHLNISDKAILAVTTEMIPALTAFFDGVAGIAAFFSVVESDLANLITDDEKRLHYQNYKLNSKTIVQHCNSFIGYIPTVKAYLDAIPFSQEDQNYVDKWLADTKKEIEENFRKEWSDQKQILDCMSKAVVVAWKSIFAIKGLH